MLNTLKSLVAKSWKNEKPDLQPGTHYFDEEFVVRISGSVEQRPDELIAPTVSIPLIPALALFWEKAGIARGPALEMLKQAMLEAMDKLAPGVASRHTLLYGVEVKFYSSRLELNDQLETKVANLFAGGDGAGMTRGLVQASVSGVMVAREILSRES